MLLRSVSIVLTLILLAGAWGAGSSMRAPSGDEGSGAASSEGGHSYENHTLETADNVTIVFTVFRPAAADNGTVPLVLHSHGWGGSRASEIDGLVEDLLDEGYGVLSFDARGHGESTGYSTIHHKDHEIQDIIKLIDWAHAQLDWATQEGAEEERDLVLGAVGGSYGGGYQLLTASHDARLDAIVPQMTWNDLRYSLAPNGVVKSVWVDALYGAGLASVDMHPKIHEWFAEAMLTNKMPAEADAHFVGSSPVPQQIQAATLLVQGLPDVLFNWNEAARNYEGILAGGNDDVALVGYLGGHVLPGVQPIGFMGPARGGEPCGAYGDLVMAWFDHHLKGLEVPVPSGVWYATEQGRCAKTLPPSALKSTSFGVVAAPSGAGTILLPTRLTEGVVAGLPVVEGTYKGPTDATIFFSLVVCKDCSVLQTDPLGGVTPADARLHIMDDQTTPLRLGPALETGIPFRLEMTGVASDLGRGDKLFLRIDGLNEWYATNSARPPAAALFGGLTLQVPHGGFECLSGLPGLPPAFPPWVDGADCQL